MSRIALVGNLSLDRVAGGAPRPGGTVYHAARTAAHIGADAVAVTRCGVRDEALALRPLVSFGLPVASVDVAETTAFSFHYEGDRRIMVVDAVGDAWGAADADTWAAESLAACDWVIVGALLRSHFDPGALGALARGGRRLLLDAHGLTRVSARGPLRENAEFDRGLLRDLAVLKLNEDEAAIVAGGIDQASLEALGVPEVISHWARAAPSSSRTASGRDRRGARQRPGRPDGGGRCVLARLRRRTRTGTCACGRRANGRAVVVSELIARP